MTPKEKAQELVVDYYSVDGETIYDGITWGMAKECALIAVDKIINYEKILLEVFPSEGFKPNYWNEVKQEIEKL